MLENPRLSTVKLKKNISKLEVFYLPSHFGLHLKKELIQTTNLLQIGNM